VASSYLILVRFYFFFQAEDGIRDRNVTGVQTCALPIYFINKRGLLAQERDTIIHWVRAGMPKGNGGEEEKTSAKVTDDAEWLIEIGRASCRERGEVLGGAGGLEGNGGKVGDVCVVGWID